MENEFKIVESLEDFVEECKSKDDLTQQSLLAAKFMALLEQTGTDALIILEKKGKECSALGNGITRQALMAVLVDLFGSEPGLFEDFLKAWDHLRRCESEPDEEVTTVH